MSTGRPASFDGLVIALISAKEGGTLLSSGGFLTFPVAVLSFFSFLLFFLFTVVLLFFELFETFFEEDRRPVVSWGLLSLSSDVFVESCEDFIFLDPSIRKTTAATCK